MRQYALIVAGGKGVRMGSQIPKQFMDLAGKPVLFRTIESFYHYSREITIRVVLHPDLFKSWKDLCLRLSFDIPVQLVEGGRERYHSVKNGLQQVQEDALVAIHDGVRPLVSQRLIGEAYRLAEATGSAVPSMPLNETLREIKNGRSRMIDRTSHFTIQTPQTFRAALIKKAYRQEYRPEFTDDAILVETMGEPVHFFPGDAFNIKITRPEDLALAAMFLSAQ